MKKTISTITLLLIGFSVMSQCPTTNEACEGGKGIKTNPDKAEVLENGIDVANMQAIQQQKIEELTLYIIQLQKQMDAMQQVLSQLNGK